MGARQDLEVVYRATILALALSLAGCGESSTTTPDTPVVEAAAPPRGHDAGAQFIAQVSDFAGFHAWPSIAITADIAPGDSHLNGPRHVYYNRAPPPGSASFPVGTLFVKETDPGPVTARTVFASVKRGGDYDPTGDVNWEWFSLQNLADGTESIIWRGAGPAGGGAYGTGALGGCNTCHGAAKSFEYVLTPQLDAMISPQTASP